MSWVVDSSLTWLQKLAVGVIKCGSIPKHIAIIMDGNRRYATKTKVQKSEGHIKGFDKLAEALQWCLELGITEVTVYAFSIENFKRNKEEVDTLMALATEKFQKLLEEKQKIMDEGICIRVLGNLSLLPEVLRKLIAEACLMTRNNTRAYLNVAFAYTSQDEILNTINNICDGVKMGAITTEDIDEALITNCLYTNESPDPEIIIRTSGEVRFSNYLLWQISNSFICFSDILWPEFSIWHLLVCIFKYQRSFSDLQKSEQLISNENVTKFVSNLKEKRIKEMESYLC